MSKKRRMRHTRVMCQCLAFGRQGQKPQDESPPSKTKAPLTTMVRTSVDMRFM
jgi:hypothetical protein